MECNYCNKILSCKNSLVNHKKTNKQCLKIQNNNESNALELCEYCNKSFSHPNLKKHSLNCKSKFKILLKKKDEEIQKLREQIIEKDKMIAKLEGKNDVYKEISEDYKDIAKQPKTVNNKIFSVSNINHPEKVKELIDNKLTNNHVIDGQKGIAQFAYNNLLKDDDGNLNYFCTDSSRNMFKFINDEGEIEKDIKASKLTAMLFDAGLKDKSSKIAIDIWTNDDGTINIDKFQNFLSKANEILLMKDDNSIFRNELACMTSV
jgi:hypothetical protein